MGCMGCRRAWVQACMGACTRACGRGTHRVDEEVHDRLGHRVLQVLAHDAVVGDEQGANDIRLELLARRAAAATTPDAAARRCEGVGDAVAALPPRRRVRRRRRRRRRSRRRRLRLGGRWGGRQCRGRRGAATKKGIEEVAARAEAADAERVVRRGATLRLRGRGGGACRRRRVGVGVADATRRRGGVRRGRGVA